MYRYSMKAGKTRVVKPQLSQTVWSPEVWSEYVTYQTWLQQAQQQVPKNMRTAAEQAQIMTTSYIDRKSTRLNSSH